jgi:hypothetical protein
MHPRCRAVSCSRRGGGVCRTVLLAAHHVEEAISACPGITAQTPGESTAGSLACARSCCPALTIKVALLDLCSAFLQLCWAGNHSVGSAGSGGPSGTAPRRTAAAGSAARRPAPPLVHPQRGRSSLLASPGGSRDQQQLSPPPPPATFLPLLHHHHHHLHHNLLLLLRLSCPTTHSARPLSRYPPAGCVP